MTPDDPNLPPLPPTDPWQGPLPGGLPPNQPPSYPPPGQGYPPPSYPPPGQNYPPQGFPPDQGYLPPHTSGKAIGSLVSAIVGGVLGMFCCFPAPIGGIVAIVLAHTARSDIRASGGSEEGSGLAMAGEIIGWIEVVLIIPIVLIIVLILLGNQTKNVFSNISSGLGTQ